VEVFIENLHEIVNGFEVEQVVVRDVNTDAEVQASVSPVYYFEIPEFYKVGMFGISNCNYGMNLFNKFLLLFILKVNVPLGQSSFPSSILNHDKFDPHFCGEISPFLKLLKCYTQAM